MDHGQFPCDGLAPDAADIDILIGYLFWLFRQGYSGSFEIPLVTGGRDGPSFPE